MATRRCSFRPSHPKPSGSDLQDVHTANPYALQAAEVTRQFPIVSYDCESDPVAAGFTAAFRTAWRPQRCRRLPWWISEVSGKLLQMLAEIVSGLSRVAVLSDAPLASAQLKATERTRHAG